MKLNVLLLAAAFTAACGSHDEQAATAPQTSATAAAAPQAIGDLEDPPNDPGDTAASRPAPAPASAETALLPPGVEPRRGGALAPGETALSYTASATPQATLAWYRSSQRRGAFNLDSELEEGAEHVLSGSLAPRAGGARADFTVRIAPAASGGTTAMVLVTGR